MAKGLIKGFACAPSPVLARHGAAAAASAPAVAPPVPARAAPARAPRGDGRADDHLRLALAAFRLLLRVPYQLRRQVRGTLSKGDGADGKGT
eukprot:6547949-Pyramimonas_sp.AAC.2